MKKASILDFFAGLNLAVFIIATVLFIVQGVNAAYGGTGSVLIGLGLLFAGLFQYAILGGAAEVIKRLVSIDENTRGHTRATIKPPEDEPVTLREIAQVAFGRDSRG